MIKEFLENLNTYANLKWLLLFVLVSSFVISWVTFKPLLTVVIKKHLHDEPNVRSSHKTRTPTIGGVAIYISFVLVICLFGSMLNLNGLLILVGCITTLFFLGLNDDLDTLNARKKAIIQLLVCFAIILISDIRILGFFDILGIGAFNYWQSVLFTVFVYMLVINAFNLIDGIDGLAGGLAVMACFALSVLFWYSKKYSLTALSLSLLGALVPFLRLNLSKKRKIFMGDSGSMIIGFVLAFCVVNFISYAQIDENNIHANQAPALAIAVLFYPLLDTLRIFFIRIILNRTSPFKPDRNHIHHKFLNIGYSHKLASFTIILINLIIFCIAFLLKSLNINLQMILIILIGNLLYAVPFIAKKIIMINKKKPE